MNQNLDRKKLEQREQGFNVLLQGANQERVNNQQKKNLSLDKKSTSKERKIWNQPQKAQIQNQNLKKWEKPSQPLIIQSNQQDEESYEESILNSLGTLNSNDLSYLKKSLKMDSAIKYKKEIELNQSEIQEQLENQSDIYQKQQQSKINNYDDEIIEDECEKFCDTKDNNETYEIYEQTKQNYSQSHLSNKTYQSKKARPISAINASLQKISSNDSLQKIQTVSSNQQPYIKKINTNPFKRPFSEAENLKIDHSKIENSNSTVISNVAYDIFGVQNNSQSDKPPIQKKNNQQGLDDLIFRIQKLEDDKRIQLEQIVEQIENGSLNANNLKQQFLLNQQKKKNKSEQLFQEQRFNHKNNEQQYHHPSKIDDFNIYKPKQDSNLSLQRLENQKSEKNLNRQESYKNYDKNNFQSNSEQNPAIKVQKSEQDKKIKLKLDNQNDSSKIKINQQKQESNLQLIDSQKHNEKNNLELKLDVDKNLIKNEVAHNIKGQEILKNQILKLEGETIKPPIQDKNVVIIRVLSTYGSFHVVGLTEIQIFNEEGKKIQLYVNNIQIKNTQHPNQKNIPNLINGTYQTTDENQMWTGTMPEHPYCMEIEIQLSQQEKIGALKIWNFNKGLIDSIKGVKDIEFLIRNELKWAGSLIKGVGNDIDEYCTVIKLKQDIELEDHVKKTNSIQIENVEQNKINKDGIPSWLDNHDKIKDQISQLQIKEIKTNHQNNVEQNLRKGNRNHPKVQNVFENSDKNDGVNGRKSNRITEDSDKIENLSYFNITNMGRFQPAERDSYWKNAAIQLQNDVKDTVSLIEEKFSNMPIKIKDNKKMDALDQFFNEKVTFKTKNEPFIIPNLPAGKIFQIQIYSSWGDEHYVGLTGLEIYDRNGHLFQINKRQISANPTSINIQPEYQNDPRTIDKIIDGVYSTCDDMHVWIAPFKKGSINTITIDFQQNVVISMIRIWNYNKSRIYTCRGIKDIKYQNFFFEKLFSRMGSLIMFIPLWLINMLMLSSSSYIAFQISYPGFNSDLVLTRHELNQDTVRPFLSQLNLLLLCFNITGGGREEFQIGFQNILLGQWNFYYIYQALNSYD